MSTQLLDRGRSAGGWRTAGAYVEVDLDAVAGNTARMRELVEPSSAVLAVVKADGYGLGAVPVARAALAGGATWLGVARVSEGVELRTAGIGVPILVMAYATPGEARDAVANNLVLAVHRPEIVDALERAARELGATEGSVTVHIKVDTGLGRYGAQPDEVIPLARHVAAQAHLRLEGLMTHFASADEEDVSFTLEQLARLDEVRASTLREGIDFELVHAANTAAAMRLPKSRLDMVRTGIALSGHYPVALTRDLAPLTLAVRVVSRLARVETFEAGETVGYGRTWRAAGPNPVGLVPVGYADGLPRAASSAARFLVGGEECKLAGIVSMDQCSVDLSPVPSAREGDEVVLIGTQGVRTLTADAIATASRTISYEVLVGFGRRLPRHYVGAEDLSASTV